MPWLKIDDKVRTHPKIVNAGPAAAWFWFCGICYCREHLTDGYIGDGMISSLAPGVTNGKNLAARLVESGLWHRTEGGYRVHDFLEWNPSRASVLAKRSADRARKGYGSDEDSNWNLSGSDEDSNATRDARERAPAGLGLGYGSDRNESLIGRKDQISPFDEFWAAYPRKTGKEAARKAWVKLKPSAELLEIMLAALDWQRRSTQWLKDGGQFIPHPATWLNQGRWQDEPPDPNSPQLTERSARSMGAIFGTN